MLEHAQRAAALTERALRALGDDDSMRMGSYVMVGISESQSACGSAAAAACAPQLGLQWLFSKQLRKPYEHPRDALDSTDRRARRASGAGAQFAAAGAAARDERACHRPEQ